MRQTPMAARSEPMRRGKGLERGAALVRLTPMRAVSATRAAENRLRRKIVDQLFPERPACERPGCERWADDVHEPLSRARGGSITDPENWAVLCRPCHDEITFRPDSELGWAYELGLKVHSWDAAPKGGAAA